ncbi:hypothetical protein CRUP_023241 [Coryphaenoides rupestris]|nr:hypothetical protein CRUP_023241 [Coryphaenoides rupestris]
MNCELSTRFLKVAVSPINHFHKAEDRSLLITDRHLYKMDPLKQYKPMKSIPLYNKRDSPDSASSFTLVSGELQRKDKFMRVLFSGNVRKINHFHKAEDRSLLITDRHLYKMDPLKQYKPMKSIPLYNARCRPRSLRWPLRASSADTLALTCSTSSGHLEQQQQQQQQQHQSLAAY